MFETCNFFFNTSIGFRMFTHIKRFWDIWRNAHWVVDTRTWKKRNNFYYQQFQRFEIIENQYEVNKLRVKFLFT